MDGDSMDGTENEFGCPRIFDVPNEPGIDIEFDLFPGAIYTFRMTDEQAQDLVNIIQNKLNARL